MVTTPWLRLKLREDSHSATDARGPSVLVSPPDRPLRFSRSKCFVNPHSLGNCRPETAGSPCSSEHRHSSFWRFHTPSTWSMATVCRSSLAYLNEPSVVSVAAGSCSILAHRHSRNTITVIPGARMAMASPSPVRRDVVCRKTARMTDLAVVPIAGRLGSSLLPLSIHAKKHRSSGCNGPEKWGEYLWGRAFESREVDCEEDE